jgi:hypothetical protein
MPRQSSLFDEASATGAVTSLEIAPVTGRLSKGQRRFNRLTARIESLRTELTDWQIVMQRIRDLAIGEFEPLREEFRAEQRRVVLHAEQWLSSPRHKGDGLTGRRRAKLRDFAIRRAHDVLSAGPDAEIEAAFARLSGVSPEEVRHEELELAEALFDEILGPGATSGHTAASVNELFEHVGRRVQAELEAEEQARREQATKRQSGPATDRERAARATIRDLFRRLVSALHPDREPDAAERTRKTELMQRANQAYARNDVMELLAIQIQIERIDTTHLAKASEERLGHFCTVLAEQQRLLEQELREVTQMALSLLSEAPWPGRLQPLAVEAQFRRELDALRRDLDVLRREREALADPARHAALIDSLPADADEEDPYLTIILGEPSDPTTTSRRGSRKRSKRTRHR